VKSKKIIALFMLLAVSLALGISLYAIPHLNSSARSEALPQTATESETNAKSDQPVIPEIKIVHPKLFSGRQIIAAEGHVFQLKSHALSAPSDGFIRQVYVSAGDFVKAGQKICRLENPDQGPELKHLNQELQIEQGLLQNLQQELSRQQEMLTLGLAARNSLTLLENQIKTKRLDIDRLQSQRELLARHQAQTLVAAVSSGYLQTLLPEGSHVGLGQTLATWSNAQDLALETFLPLSESRNLAPGSIAKFKGGSAQVTSITPESHNGLVRVLLASGQVLPLDFRLSLKIEAARRTGWLLPKNAIRLEEGKAQAFQIINKKVQILELKILEDQDSEVLVANALDSKDIFAANLLEMLQADSEVSYHE
jgi:multidrug efflux pump subunit AcrA (membrane-fusion protein)